MLRPSSLFKSFFARQKLFSYLIFATFFSFNPIFLTKNNQVMAQTNLPTCQAPLAGEFLVLVSTPTVETQDRLRNSVPRDMNRIICRYNGETVTRLGSLSSLDEADRWGQYVIEIVGLPAVIARPRQTVRTPVVEPSTPTATQTTYNPQALGTGYAVLVNYFNRPDIATQLRGFLVRDVGLVSYLSRPYLLALQTTNLNEANQLLSRLNRQGFWAVVVDSQGVMLLSSSVRVQ